MTVAPTTILGMPNSADTMTAPSINLSALNTTKANASSRTTTTRKLDWLEINCLSKETLLRCTAPSLRASENDFLEAYESPTSTT
jgi:hypothetical protein